MPSITAPVAAPGLPEASPNEVLVALRAGLEAHFAGLGETVDLDAPLPPAAPREPAQAPARRAVLAGGLAALLGRVVATDASSPDIATAAPSPSPLLTAIAAHAEANAAANAAALTHSRAFDDDDPAAEELLRLADEACERDDETLKALRALRPRDIGEAAMLARHYATTLEEWEEAGSLGSWLLDGLASALEGDA